MPAQHKTQIRALALGICSAVVLLVLILALQLLLPGDAHQITLPSSLRKGSWTSIVLAVSVLLVIWHHSVLLRCPDPFIKRNLTGIVVLLVLWMLDVAIKYEANSDIITSLLWYFYYVPFCLVPALALRCALHAAGLDIRKPVQHAARAMMLISCLLICLVLTNNLHHVVFGFSFASPDWSNNYVYGSGYIIIVIWIALMMCAFVAALYYSAHRTRRRTVIQLLVLLLLIAIYSVLYAQDMLPRALLNLPLTDCIAVAALTEFCLQTGMLPSYSQYEQAFANLPFDVRIFDEEANVLLRTEHAENVPDEMVAGSLPSPSRDHESGLLVLDDGRIAGKYATISGGTCVVMENIATLEHERLELARMQEDLRAQTAALSSSYHVKSKLFRLQSESALYQEVEQGLSQAVARIRLLLDNLPLANDDASTARRQQSLHQVKLLLSYCKRQGGIILMGKDGALFDEERLTLALSETMSDLRTSGVDCAVLSEVQRTISVDIASDFYRCIYAAGFLALKLVQAGMMVYIQAADQQPAQLRIALESSSLENPPAHLSDDLLLDLGSINAACTLEQEPGQIRLLCTEARASTEGSTSCEEGDRP